ncbi:MAG: L-histidine N(alpha)-methyltransferase [Longimicrobiales bacterium]
MRDASELSAARRAARRIRPQNAAVADDVWTSLNRPQKELSPKHFYDARGSALFDEITGLVEYYPTRTERMLLRRWAPGWMRGIAPRTLIELGPGSADKTRILLDALSPGASYVPVDISATYLEEIARSIGADYPRLCMLPARSDISATLHVPAGLEHPAVFAFLGSTIGNFEMSSAVRLLRRVAQAMRVEDRFLMGADLKKDRDVLERAYNDSRGVTAEFNRNILRVVNREAGTDFDVKAFDHLAYYDVAAERIEMHLVARERQAVTVPGRGAIVFEPGESVRTEISCKYDRERVAMLFGNAGLAVESWVTDDEGLYALAAGRLAGTTSS